MSGLPTFLSQPRPARLRHGGAWLILVWAAAVCWPAAAAAQELDADMEKMLEQVNARAADYEQTPVSASQVDPVNMSVHWRLWKRLIAEGNPGTDELEALAYAGFSTGHRNLPAYATAVYAMADTAVDGAQLSVHDAANVYDLSRKLAPDLPYPEFAYSAHLVDHNIGRLPAIVSSYMRGVAKARRWLDTRVAWQLKLTSWGLGALFVAGLIFLLAQLLRYFGIIAYDAARLLPAGFSSSQTVILIVAAVVVPGVLLRSPLLSIVVLLTMLGLVQRVNERVVTLVILGGLAALPIIDGHMADQVTWPNSSSQRLMHAQYLDCDSDCIAELEARRADKSGPAPVLTYSIALGHYRQGQPKHLKRVQQLVGSPDQWPAQMQPAVQNLLGATLVAQAKPDAALSHLQKAKSLAPSSPAAAFNQMRAFQMKQDPDAASAALDDAIAADLAAVRTHLDMQRRDVNSYLFVEPLPAALFWQRHRRSSSAGVSALTPVWSALAGPNFPLDRAPWMGCAAILVVLVSVPLVVGRRASSPCPKCGLARDPQDAPSTGGHRYCLPCYHTFVSGASLEYDARVHNERVLGRRERFQDVVRRGLSVVMPGAGHIQAGHGFGGFLVSFITFFGILVIWRPMGIWRPPYELFGNNWAAQISAAWGLVSFGALVGLGALARGIRPTALTSSTSPNGGSDE